MLCDLPASEAAAKALLVQTRIPCYLRAALGHGPEEFLNVEVV